MRDSRLFSARSFSPCARTANSSSRAFEDAVLAVDQRLELLHPLLEPGPQLLVDLGGNRVESGERAAQRKQDQRQVAWRRRIRRLDQRVVDRRNLLLRLLLGDVGRNRLDQVGRRRCASIWRERRVGRDRPPLRELGIHHQDAGRHKALASSRRRGEAAQELLLAGDYVQPGSDKIVELLQVAPQNNRGFLDLGQRHCAERGVP